MGNLASAVDELLAVDPRCQPDSVNMDEIEQILRERNRLDAAYLARLEAVDRSGAALADHGSTAAWLRATAKMAPNVASRDVHLSRDLADAMPSARAALADGVISPAHAQLIASLRRAISPDAFAAAEPHLVDFATRATTKDLRGAITHVKHMYGRDKQRVDEPDD